MRSENGGSQHIVVYNIAVSTSYLIEIQWALGASAGGNHDVDCTVNATKLVLAGNTEYSGTVTTSMRDTGSKSRLYLSDAQSGMDSKFSSMVLLHGTDATERATIKAYLEKRWKNQSTTPVVDPDAVSSTWLSEIRY